MTSRRASRGGIQLGLIGMVMCLVGAGAVPGETYVGGVLCILFGAVFLMVARRS